jgi:predicted dehydrogenase
MAGKHPDRAAQIQANIAELRIHDSLDSLLEQVDMVDIATHARGRMPSAIAAFEKGVSAMAEKPMARTWTEADRAARTLEKHPEVLFQLNDDNVFEPKYRLIHDLIRRGEIGEVQSVTLIRGSGLDAKTVLKAQANGLENGGGCMMDYGSHGLAGAISFFGPDYRPIKVKAVHIGVLYPHRVLEDEPFTMEVDDNAQFKVLLENQKTGAWATIFMEATWCGGHIGKGDEKPGSQGGGYLEVVGDKAVIESRSFTSMTLKYYSGGEEEIPLIHYPGETVSVHNEMQSFFTAFREGGKPEIDIRFGADVIAICGAAYLSAIRGSAVTLEEFKDFSRDTIKKFGDNEKADDAIVLELLKPYRRRK